MLIFSGKRICILAISVCLIGIPLAQPATASVISTEQAIELDERQSRIDNISEMFARDAVHNTLVRFGVEPADAAARVDALTNAELLTLEQQLQSLPAGGTGIVEVVGIVAIVLIILELLHITNFFAEF